MCRRLRRIEPDAGEGEADGGQLLQVLEQQLLSQESDRQMEQQQKLE